MTIKIETRKYEASHGKQPRGEGSWGFIFSERVQFANGHSDEERVVFSPTLPYRSACAWFRKYVREQVRYQDLVAHVAP